MLKYWISVSVYYVAVLTIVLSRHVNWAQCCLISVIEPTPMRQRRIPYNLPWAFMLENWVIVSAKFKVFFYKRSMFSFPTKCLKIFRRTVGFTLRNRGE